MTLHALLLPTLGRWLGLLALAILVGNLVLELVVLPRDLAQLESARRRLRHWITAVVALLIVTSAGDLIARAGVMTGGDLSQAMAALPLVLTRTHFGAIWISRGGRWRFSWSYRSPERCPVASRDWSCRWASC